MNLSLHDLHVIFAPGALSVWDVNHHRIFSCQARNKTTADGQLGHNGNCPPGEYLLGVPIAMGSVPFGPFFISVTDYNGHHTMQEHGRSGIGIHGGGSGLADPFADEQGWQITHGCIRLQNKELRYLVRLVTAVQMAGGQCLFTVNTAAAVTTPAWVDEDWGPAAELADGE